MNIYELSRRIWDYAFEHTGKIKPNDIAVYFFIIEQANRMGWKKTFGLPSSMIMEATGIRSHNTYKASLDKLIRLGYIKMVSPSKNQFTANIISIIGVSKNDEPNSAALDKANIKQVTEQILSTHQSTCGSIDSIDKPINQLTNIPINHSTSLQKASPEKVKKFTTADFKKIFIDLGAEEIHVNDWIAVRHKRKSVNSQTALKKIVDECALHNFPVSDAIKVCAENSWAGFKHEWLANSLSNNNTNGNRSNSTGRTMVETAREASNAVDQLLGPE